MYVKLPLFLALCTQGNGVCTLGFYGRVHGTHFYASHKNMVFSFLVHQQSGRGGVILTLTQTESYKDQ